MIVNEAMTNAAKYAYSDRKRGTFNVTGKRIDGFYHLSCIDDGPGIKGGQSSDSGLGMRILLAAAQQLRGELLMPERDIGCEITVVWPVED
jgi:two-component sensor histidine kinase